MYNAKKNRNMKLYKIIIYGLLFLSIIVIAYINFFENYWISCFKQLDSDKLNRLIEIIAIAYVTSFIFYYVVVVLKENQDKKIILPFVADYTYIAMNNCMMFCSIMRKWAGLEFIQIKNGIHNRSINLYPNSDDLKIICSSINPDEEINEKIGSDGSRRIPHFFGNMIMYSHYIDYYIKIILEKSRFLDTEFIRILTDIQTSGYHQLMVSYDIKSIYNAKEYHHKSLEVYKESFQNYFDIFLKLESYAEKELKKYVERESLKRKE